MGIVKDDAHTKFCNKNYIANISIDIRNLVALRQSHDYYKIY